MMVVEERFCFDNTIQNWALIFIGACALIYLGSYMASKKKSCDSKEIFQKTMDIFHQCKKEYNNTKNNK